MASLQTCMSCLILAHYVYKSTKIHPQASNSHIYIYYISYIFCIFQQVPPYVVPQNTPFGGAYISQLGSAMLPTMDGAAPGSLGTTPVPAVLAGAAGAKITRPDRLEVGNGHVMDDGRFWLVNSVTVLILNVTVASRSASGHVATDFFNYF